MAAISFKVKGLDCAEEVAILKDALRSHVDSEDQLRFDILRGKLSIDTLSQELSSDRIRAAIDKTGMKAVPWDEYQSSNSAPQNWFESHSHTLLAGASGIATLSGFALHVFYAGWVDALTAGEEPGLAYPLPTAVLFLVAIATGFWFVFPKAWYALRSLRADMNLLMVIAVTGALILGNWLEGALVAFLFSIALLLESWSVSRARRAISGLLNMAPQTARCLEPENGTTREVERPVEEVQVGSRVQVRPGERIPLDGIVRHGATSVNQAPITGESAPVSKAGGDTVYAGSINNEAAFEFEVTKPADQSSLARIIHMVEEAQARRAPVERWVDRFARVYTPVMILIAIGVATIPPLFFDVAWSQAFYSALVMLLIACPCALVISTPVSIVAGLSAAARAGVLIKGGAFLELPARIKVLVFDKTGTLTQGTPQVQEVRPFNGTDETELVRLSASVESMSQHPLAKAVLRYAEARGIDWPVAESHVANRGRGAAARIDGREYWIGAPKLHLDNGYDLSPDAFDYIQRKQDEGNTVVALGSDTQILGALTLSDSPRPAAKEALQRVKRIGVETTVVLTGDNERTAHAVAESLHVDRYESELLPEHKVDAIRELQREFGRVAMVGDGINDAPALAASDLGIAMGAIGSDAAIETADVALMSDDLARVPWLIRHSQRTLRTINQNIAVALGIKAVVFVLALAGWATLWLAIAADMGASLIVIANGLRLLRIRDATDT